jgi:hypothetical protein
MFGRGQVAFRDRNVVAVAPDLLDIDTNFVISDRCTRGQVARMREVELQVARVTPIELWFPSVSVLVRDVRGPDVEMAGQGLAHQPMSGRIPISLLFEATHVRPRYLFL